MPLDAEGVRQREAHPPTRIVRDAAGLPVGLLGLRPVEEVPLQVRDVGGGDEVAVDVLGAQELRRPEVGVHRPLGIGGDHDQAAPGGRTLGGGRAPEHRARGPQVVREHRTELVVEHPTDERGLAAEAGDARDRVGGGATGRLDRVAHGRVDLLGARRLDERHRTLHEAVGLDEGVVLDG